MIGVGQRAPDFTCPALVGTEFRDVSLADYRGKWVFLYFYPHDFSFICPTEVKAFSDLAPEFEDRDCVVLGASCDSVYSHLGWVNAKNELKGLKHALLGDFAKSLAAALGIVDHPSGAAQRASFLIDPDGVVRFVYVTELNIGRSPEEVLRILDALQADGMCPCNWRRGDPAPKA